MTTTAQLIEDRIGHNWNDWPDLETVSINSYDMSDFRQVYDFAYALGRAMTGGVMRQVLDERLPADIADILSRDSNLWHLNSLWFDLATAHGQVDDTVTRNLVAVIPPRKGYDFKTRRQTFESPGLIIEIGCRHEYETKRLGNCYHGGTCIRCGHEWKVDSSG